MRKVTIEAPGKSPRSGGTKEWKNLVRGMTAQADGPYEVEQSGKTRAFRSAGCGEKYQKERTVTPHRAAPEVR